MNKSKLALSIFGTVVLGWLMLFVNSFVSVQCTEVNMMTARDPMGPIWLYKQLSSFCDFGNAIVIVVGLILIGLIWYFAYLKKFFNDLKENQ